MNYIQQLNGYWKLADLCDSQGFRFKPYHHALYLALLHINNRLFWRKWFSLTLSEGIKTSGLSKPTYYKSLYQLEDMGLIRLRGKGQSTAPIEISIIQWGKNIDLDNEELQKRGKNIGSANTINLPPGPKTVAIYCHILKQDKTKKNRKGKDFFYLGEREPEPPKPKPKPAARIPKAKANAKVLPQSSRTKL